MSKFVNYLYICLVLLLVTKVYSKCEDDDGDDTPARCAATSCLAVSQCPNGQVLIPADLEECRCCSFCMDAN